MTQANPFGLARSRRCLAMDPGRTSYMERDLAPVDTHPHGAYPPTRLQVTSTMTRRKAGEQAFIDRLFPRTTTYRREPA